LIDFLELCSYNTIQAEYFYEHSLLNVIKRENLNIKIFLL
jgi:hypothetical protein